MHECPECGQACDCSGDWDDCEVMNPEWVFTNCECCESQSSEDELGDDVCPVCSHDDCICDDDDWDNDDHSDGPDYYSCSGCGSTQTDTGMGYTCNKCGAGALNEEYF